MEMPAADSWTNRRSFMLLVIAFCMAVIAYVLFTDKTTTVAEDAASMAFNVILIALMGYVFGAVGEYGFRVMSARKVHIDDVRAGN